MGDDGALRTVGVPSIQATGGARAVGEKRARHVFSIQKTFTSQIPEFQKSFTSAGSLSQVPEFSHVPGDWNLAHLISEPFGPT